MASRQLGHWGAYRPGCDKPEVGQSGCVLSGGRCAFVTGQARREHALAGAARTAATMRSNLQARHGGISDVVSEAPVRVAERHFYHHGAG